MDRAGLQEYFGIPPAPETELATNIKEKRRLWHGRSNSPANREKAERIKELIRKLEQHLINGFDLPDGILTGEGARQDVDDLPVPVFEVVEELIELIGNLLRRGQNKRALDAASEGMLQFPNASQLERLFLDTAVQTGIETRDAITDELLIRAYALSDKLLERDPADIQVWLSRFSLLTLLGRFDSLAQIEAEARTKLGSLPPSITLAVGEALLSTGRGREGLARLLSAVDAPEADSGIRGKAVDIALSEAKRHLPITSSEALDWFSQVVDVAAWCARGFGAEEAVVRPFRMWAARAENRVFTGNRPLRALLAVLTGFQWVRLHNARKSEFVWKVLLDGPMDDGQDNFELVSGSAYVRDVHKKVTFPWFVNGSWPASS
jgi:hypothetical protein